jgi:hypothetical protein
MKTKNEENDLIFDGYVKHLKENDQKKTAQPAEQIHKTGEAQKGPEPTTAAQPAEPA